VARHQQYESIVDTGYEQLTAQYEAVHNNTLEHIGEVSTQVNQFEGQSTSGRRVNNVDDDGYWLVLDVQATQGNQLEGRPPANHWVNNVDEDGYWQVLNDEQRVPFDAEAYLQVLNDNNLALSEQPGDCNQQDRQAASVDSYGYLQPVVNNDAEVHALQFVSLIAMMLTVADSDTSKRSNPLYTAQDQSDTPPNPLYTAQNNTAFITVLSAFGYRNDTPASTDATIACHTQVGVLTAR
jgi:hypothetical protein